MVAVHFGVETDFVDGFELFGVLDYANLRDFYVAFEIHVVVPNSYALSRTEVLALVVVGHDVVIIIIEFYVMVQYNCVIHFLFLEVIGVLVTEANAFYLVVVVVNLVIII